MFRFIWRRQRPCQSRSSATSGVPGNPSEFTARKAGCSPVTVEPLEQRTLLSWPIAPFDGPAYRASIHVNQNGNATVSAKLPHSRRPFQGYEFFFDGGGRATVRTIGGLPADIAFYNKPSRPLRTSTDPGSSGSGILKVTVPPDKRPLYLGVRAHDGKSVGAYKLVIRGVVDTFLPQVPISPGSNIGVSGTTISGGGDHDFYEFTTPQAGNWQVIVTPLPPTSEYPVPLDLTMNVYSRKGKPIGGTFIHPVDRKGPGAAETWVARNLPAGKTLVVRVDGAGESTGTYRITMSRIGPAAPE